MNEKEAQNQVDKGLDDKRKNAMLRYIGIMFVVAFLFVLISMLSELRTSEATITELNQSSTSAIQKAEQLQDNNRQLETDNAYLTGRIEELEKQIEDLELELAVSEEKVQNQEADLSALDQQLTEARQETSELLSAYENLLKAEVLAEQNEDNSSILKELKYSVKYFAEYASNIYENLTKEGE